MRLKILPKKHQTLPGFTCNIQTIWGIVLVPVRKWILGIQEADRQVGMIWSAIKEREEKFDEEWLITITTDHGRGEGGFHHGGQN